MTPPRADLYGADMPPSLCAIDADATLMRLSVMRLSPRADDFADGFRFASTLSADRLRVGASLVIPLPSPTSARRLRVGMISRLPPPQLASHASAGDGAAVPRAYEMRR